MIRRIIKFPFKLLYTLGITLFSFLFISFVIITEEKTEFRSDLIQRELKLLKYFWSNF